jgi:hypothetical protein
MLGVVGKLAKYVVTCTKERIEKKINFLFTWRPNIKQQILGLMEF